MNTRLDIKNMPVLNMLYGYKKQRPVRFHMPGHKSAAVFKRYLGDIADIDITELSFSDNLLQPQTVIRAAEKLYAEATGCKAVKLCTCGSTTAIISLFYSLKAYGDLIIIARNSHKSVYSALKICGIEPILVDNDYDSAKNLYKNITAEQVERTLDQSGGGVIGAFITSPDYFGNFADMDGIHSALSARGKLLAADASHGAHTAFTDGKHYSGCAAYICSAHKTLPALTQGSFACFNDLELYGSFLHSFDLFHTTSPSYPVLASLDFAREYMVKRGGAQLKRLSGIAAKYKDIITSLGYAVQQTGDILKMLIDVSGKGFSGFYAAEYLESRGIFVELANEKHLLLMLGIADDAEKPLKRLVAALKKLGEKGGELKSCGNKFAGFKLSRGMGYLQAHSSEAERVSLTKAVGRVAACDAGIFPPSVPLVCCGDILTEEVCEYLISHSARTFGLDKGTIFVVK